MKTMSFLSTSEQVYILEGCCRDNIRLDGRQRVEQRPFALLMNNPLVTSHGSSRVILGCHNGGTHVLCSIKAELVHPSPAKPNQGALEIHVDTLTASSSSSTASSSSSRRLRRQQEQELQSTLMFLLEPHIVDLTGLAVVPGLYVWKLNIDLLVLSDQQGSLLDVCSRAIRAAIQTTKLPHMTALNHDLTTVVDDEQQQQQSAITKGGAQVDLAVDGDIQNAVTPVGADDCPIIVTVSVLACPPKNMSVLVLDTTLEEEAVASSQVHVVVRPSGQVCSVLMSQSGSIRLGLLSEITSTAVKASRQVFEEMNKQSLSGDWMTTSPQSLLQEQFQVK
jgi:exosome complex RNA-binding protein Rrp42 (RNase PH superfamily)